MTARDRTIIGVLAVVVLMAAFWFALLGPKRDDAKALSDKIATAQQRLETANQQAAAARQAKAGYARDYAAVARLGKAVPADADVPSLLYQLQSAAGSERVGFDSIKLSSSGGAATAQTSNATPAAQVAQLGQEQKTGSSTAAPATATPAPATQVAATALPPGAVVGAAGFPTMPFDFSFSGRFFSLDGFLHKLDDFARVKSGGQGVAVSGRLLTVDGFALTPAASASSTSSATAASPSATDTMTASIHATAYLLPDDQGLTNGATPQAPATAAPSTTATTPTTTGAPAASPTAAATITGAGR